MHLKIRLGTRKSLLAWAQSSWVAREIERLNPGVKVELHGIETRGDKILDIPLQAVAGKEFFVAEIDDALRAKTVDLTVHSMKDLSLDRPAEFILGAVPKRENPRDVIVFGPSAIPALKSGRAVKIGTSSPRRLENIPPFLAKALPRFDAVAPQAKLVEIRGNVNTRLSRTREPVGSEKHLDGVVLAFAGLIRLWNDEKGREELTRLLDGARWMVLPLRECPAAPAQGALAVECRRDDARVRDVLAKLHDALSSDQAAAERQMLADWGGGCHQKFGATCIGSPDLGELLFIRGRKPDETFVDELRWRGGPSPRKPGPTTAWNGAEWRAGSGQTEVLEPRPDVAGQAMFIAHSRALTLPALAALRVQPAARVWTSGTASWFRLADQGVWVEGSAEGLGFEQLAPTLLEPVLRLPSRESWTILTHDTASEGWEGARVVATYRVKPGYPPDASEALKAATHVYWSSGSQFDELGRAAPKSAEHACGPGKTARHLRAQGLNPRVFPSVEEWKQWLKNSG
ncbi:MAG TPA: hydroxymethylbilane synthase [Bdellovibrionota bacterium]|nr:hydroxymethylbilane synthase [Bdellovibrionota bacterium]